MLRQLSSPLFRTRFVTDKVASLYITYLLVEDRLSLSTISALFSVVTPLSLCKDGISSLLVLRHLMQSVFSALGSFAERPPGLGYVNHDSRKTKPEKHKDTNAFKAEAHIVEILGKYKVLEKKKFLAA